MADYNLVGKRVLVTGAGGFIGSHLTEYLVGLGAEVCAFVHYNAAGRWGWLQESSCSGDFEVVLGDVTDRDCVRSAVAERDLVFHLAALIGIPYSYQAPSSYINTNITGTFNVLQSALDSEVERVVHTSTSETYGSARYVPIDEAHPLQGQSPYAATKIGADKLAESFYCSFDLPVVTVRPFNTYGPRQSTRAIIPTVIVQALAGEAVRLGATSPRRDMNYVEDTVRGFVAAALGGDENLGEVFNLGSGQEVAIGDLAEQIVRLTDERVEIRSDEERVRPEKSEVNRLLADNNKACRQLDWAPQIPLEEGLQRTIEWFRQRGRLDNYKGTRYAV